MVLTLYRMYVFFFQICNRLVELMKSGDAGIFPVYYSLKTNSKLAAKASALVGVEPTEQTRCNVCGCSKLMMILKGAA